MPKPPLKKTESKLPPKKMERQERLEHKERILETDSVAERKERMERLERHLGRHPKTVVDAIEAYLKRYIVLDESEYLPIAAWIVAAWLCDLSEWDRFPHLAITFGDNYSSP